jgi:ABC-type transport system involved in cytochrome c biogenesis permease component
VTATAAARVPAPVSVGVPGPARRPTLARLVRSEVRHSDSLLWRDPGGTFFAVAFPVLLVLLVPQIYGADAVLDDGTPLARFYAPTMAVYGAAVTAYVNMPEGLARARERGVLHRLSGTPLPMPVLVLARVVSSAWIAVLTLVGVMAVAGALYRVPVPGTWPSVVVTTLLSTVCFAVLGVALTTLLGSSRSVTAVALGTLLPLSFVSDIFVVGVQFPRVLDVIGWISPLRHATRAVSDAYSVGASGLGFAWFHLGVITLWLLGGTAVVWWRTRTGHLTGARG